MHELDFEETTHNEKVDEAHVQRDEWVGTIAFDEPTQPHTLEEWLGIPEGYRLVGLDLYSSIDVATEHEPYRHVTAHIVPRGDDREELERRVADNNGVMETIEYDLGPDVFDKILRDPKRLQIVIKLGAMYWDPAGGYTMEAKRRVVQPGEREIDGRTKDE